MNTPRLLSHRSVSVAGGIAFTALALLVPVGLAQTPVGVTNHTEKVHPAQIHDGTCNDLGEVAYSVLDVSVPSDAMREGAETAHPVKVSQDVVDIPLTELIAGGYAINVSLSAEEIDVSIACGDIGGFVITDPAGRTELFVGLGELNDSGHTGVVRLGVGDDANQTEVSIQLIEPDAMQ